MGLDATSLAALAAKRSAATEAMFPATIILAGTEYAAATVGSDVALRYEVGGEEVEADKVFEVRTAVMATAPARGERFVWQVSASDLRHYRVRAVSERPHSNVWRIYAKRLAVR